MNSQSNQSTSPGEQLAAARLAHWHQNGEPVVTINMLRDWLNSCGLILFTSRAAQLPAPAPSFVEAVLGVSNAAPTLADTEQTRSLLTRLLLDGGAIALNLLGNPTGAGSETPDFLVSPLAFPYLFTLRGDKAWKQPPTTQGASKVSPLALNTYTLLVERADNGHATGMSAYDLATQLGKEVTETAVLRALTELWQHLRVLPVPQLDGAATLWELTSARFTKQIKAGANAGQPTALSALISLYLGQAMVASEEEIETFLSPVASRSRIRDVVHALLSARQLETIAVEGRTVLHVAGDLPGFLSGAAAIPSESSSAAVVTADQTGEADGAPRITKFVPKPRKVGTGFVAKPGRSSSEMSTPRERRPFTRESNRPDRPSFTKPWAEEKADRLAASQSLSRVPDGADAGPARPPARSFEGKPASDREGKRRPETGRPTFGRERSSFGGTRPSFRRDSDSGDGRPTRREFPSREDRAGASNSSSDRPRKTFSKPGTFGRKREGAAGDSSFRRESDARPPRREFTSRPSGEQSSDSSERPRRSFEDKSKASSFGGARKPGSYAARPPSGDRAYDGARGSGRPRTSGDVPSGGAPRKPWTPREEGSGPARFAGGTSGFSRGRDDRAPRSSGFGASRGTNSWDARSKGRKGRPAGPPYRKFDAPRTPRPFSTDRPARPEGGYAGKSGDSSGAKKPFSKSSGGFAGKSGSLAGRKPYGKSASSGTGKPASTFDKFKGNKKPFGNRPPARKFKREENE